MKRIIGITGLPGVGKKTVSYMIQYLIFLDKHEDNIKQYTVENFIQNLQGRHNDYIPIDTETELFCSILNFDEEIKKEFFNGDIIRLLPKKQLRYLITKIKKNIVADPDSIVKMFANNFIEELLIVENLFTKEQFDVLNNADEITILVTDTKYEETSKKKIYKSRSGQYKVEGDHENYTREQLYEKYAEFRNQNAEFNLDYIQDFTIRINNDGSLETLLKTVLKLLIDKNIVTNVEI